MRFLAFIPYYRSLLRHHTSVWAMLLVVGMLSMSSVVAGDLEYRFESGDTLIGLGERLLDNPQDWRKIQDYNKIANAYAIPVGSILLIPYSLLRDPPLYAEVLEYAGEVRLSGEALVPEGGVAPGRLLQTGKDGSVTILLHDGSSILLPPSSALRLQHLRKLEDDGLDVDLSLEEGRVESRVSRQRGPAARYQIHTPTAIIGVRGTTFRVSQGHGQTLAEVSEGKVSVSHQDPALGTGRMVNAGQGIVVEADQPLPEPTQLLLAPDLQGMAETFTGDSAHFSLPEVQASKAMRVRIVPLLAQGRIVHETVSLPGEDLRIALPPGDYLMRVRAIDGHGLEGMEASHRFSIQAPSAGSAVQTPVLVPSASVQGENILLHWDETNASYYQFELAMEETFSWPLWHGQTFLPRIYLPQPGPGHYWLRVRGVYDQNETSNWSSALSFYSYPGMYGGVFILPDGN